MKRAIIILMFVLSFVLAQSPSRLGVALGYMTTPNSFVYRNTLSENSALDLWIDIPEGDVGDVSGWQAGAGAGYAMFLNKQEYVAIMLRPQIWLGYYGGTGDYFKIAFGAAGAVTAYLDSLGIPNTDVYAGISLGSTITIGDNFTHAHLLLATQRPFGLLLGVMKYF